MVVETYILKVNLDRYSWESYNSFHDITQNIWFQGKNLLGLALPGKNVTPLRPFRCGKISWTCFQEFDMLKPRMVQHKISLS